MQSNGPNSPIHNKQIDEEPQDASIVNGDKSAQNTGDSIHDHTVLETIHETEPKPQEVETKPQEAETKPEETETPLSRQEMLRKQAEMERQKRMEARLNAEKTEESEKIIPLNDPAEKSDCCCILQILFLEQSVAIYYTFSSRSMDFYTSLALKEEYICNILNLFSQMIMIINDCIQFITQ